MRADASRLIVEPPSYCGGWVMVTEVTRAIIKAVDDALGYLRSGAVNRDVVGKGAFGDVSKGFDVESERIIAESVADYLGKAVLFVGEELGARVVGEGEPEWVVIADPVDGSTNYDVGIPWASVAVAAAPYKEKVTIKDITSAVVAEIFRDVKYVLDSGSVSVNGAVPERRSPPKALLLGYFEVPDAYKPVPAYWRIRGKRAALRSLGSAALDIVYVGLGRAEGFVDARAKLRNVDIAASVAIAEALGARALSCDGSPVSDVRVDGLVRVPCIVVGYDEVRANALLRAVREGLGD